MLLENYLKEGQEGEKEESKTQGSLKQKNGAKTFNPVWRCVMTH